MFKFKQLTCATCGIVSVYSSASLPFAPSSLWGPFKADWSLPSPCFWVSTAVICINEAAAWVAGEARAGLRESAGRCRDARTRPRKAGSRACAARAAEEATAARSTPGAARRHSGGCWWLCCARLLRFRATDQSQALICRVSTVRSGLGAGGATSGGAFPGPRLLAPSTSLTEKHSRCCLGTR